MTAKTPTPADTKDASAAAFVESGASAKDSVKDPEDTPSSEELRAGQDASRALMFDDIQRQVDGGSNHNSLSGVNPVPVAQLDKPDYNPQRRPSSKANQQSALAESPQDMADRVDEKKDNPSNAELTEDRRERANEALEKPLAGYQSPYEGEQ